MARGGAGARDAPGGRRARRAILIQHYRDLLPLSLYVPGLHFMGGAGATVSELDVVSFTSPPSAGFCWWGSACNLWPSRAQSSYPVAGFHAVSRRHELQFTVVRLVAPHPVRLTPAAVSRRPDRHTARERRSADSEVAVPALPV